MSDRNGAWPKGWVPTTVGEVCSVTMGNSPPSSTYNESGEGMPLINGPVEFTEGQLGQTRITKYTTQPARTCNEGDFLLCVRGSTTGRSNIAAFNACIGRGVAAIRSPDSQTFVNHFVASRRESIYDMGTGSTFPSISQKQIAAIPLGLPPLAEQHRIVSKIESLQERSSRARQALEDVGPLLEQFRQSVLQAAFSGRLTAEWRAANPEVEPASELLSCICTERRHRWEQSELAKYESKGKKPPKNWQDKYKKPEPVNDATLPELPASWAWGTLEELLSEPLTNGRSVRDGNGVPVLRLTALRNRKIDLTETKLGDWTEEAAERFFVQEDDFLVSRGNGSINLVGRGGVVVSEPESPIAYPDTLIRVRLINDVSIELIALLWDSGLIRDQIQSAAKTTAGIHKISQSDLESLLVPVMPKAEQEQLVELLTAALSVVDEMEREAAESESSLTQLDQSILAKAFRGELVPQDPNDEPASDLLARIRATKEAAAPTKARIRKSGKRKAQAKA